MRKVLIVVVLAFPLAGVGAAPAMAGFRANVFASPSRNLVCAYKWRIEVMECESIADKRGGIIFRLARQGSPSTYKDRPGVANPYAVPILDYGWTWTAPGFKCRMLTDGVRCFNQLGHGFFLGRGTLSVF